MLGFKQVGMPKDYSQMLNRLFWWYFVESLVGILLLLMNDRIEAAVRYSVQSIPIISTITDVFKGLGRFFIADHLVAVILLALILAGISRILTLHNQISRILGIRHSFDVRHVLEPLALASGAQLGPERQKRFCLHSQTLMRDIFYRYASSTASDPVVDKHDIQKALENWTFCWVTVEGIFLCLIFLVISFAMRDDYLISIFSIVLIAYAFAYTVFRNRAEKLIVPQIRALLSNGAITQEIRETLNAI